MRIPTCTERKITMKVIGTCRKMSSRRRRMNERSLRMEEGLAELSTRTE
jgi:hypothetical protein